MIGIVYLVLGIFAFFVPGFLLSFLVFSEGLDRLERIATSVGLSVLLIMVTLTGLAHFDSLYLVPFMGAILVFCAVCAVLLFAKKSSWRSFVNFWPQTDTQE